MEIKGNQPALNKNEPEYVVGIGASAGGMEAIHEIFDSMPDNTDFSFVVIQHLSPDYKSLMAELLAKHTMMKVFEAEDNMDIRANCVYVIPAKNTMTLTGGKIKLHAKVKGAAPNNAIDIFFQSLATEKKNKSVGIILSGTGSDGTAGVQEIKSNGGFVIVQDPMSAGFDGMPNSAIATGSADLILPAEMIAEELISQLKDQPSGSFLPGTLNEAHELTFREILDVLHKNTRYDFTYYKRPTLLRRLAKRMSELNMTSLDEYHQYIKSHSGEVNVLSKEFLINVTKFFRDPEAFTFLRNEIIPNIVRSKKDIELIKIWCAACSTGEEAYTLAILFHEHLNSKKNRDLGFKIFATDIDANALDIASRGIYPLTIENDVPKNFLEKYFIREENHYRISPVIRKSVVFAHHDLLKDPPFSRLDLVSCRNMLIYVNQILQKQALKKFHFAINIDGYIWLGPSENIGILKDATQEVNRKWKIFRCVNKAGLIDKEIYMTPLDRKVNIGHTGYKSTAPNLTELLKETLIEQRTIAGITIDREFNVKNAIGKFKNFFRFTDDNFNLNLLKLVTPDLAVALGLTVRKAIGQNENVTLKRVTVHDAKNIRHVNIFVKPVLYDKDNAPYLFILLEEDSGVSSEMKSVVADSISSADRIEELEKELLTTRENLQSVIEEMETTNEELQSSNEEMISTNEELQSTNEELQSLNEELHTVSAEHQLKIKELLELNDDLDNYFKTSNTAQIVVDKKLVIRKFNPLASQIVKLINSDVGRSIVDISTHIDNDNFINDIKEVLKTNRPVEKELDVKNDVYYLMRIYPYIRRDGVNEGAVITFVDITAIRKLTQMIEGIFKSSPGGITVQEAIWDDDRNLKDMEIVAVNESFMKLFNFKNESLAGKKLSEIFKNSFDNNIKIYSDVINSGKPYQAEYFDKEKERWYELSVVKLMNGVVTTYSDITERKKAIGLLEASYHDLKKASDKLLDSNSKLEQSNLDLMQFASVASHDLKEPLRKIQTFGNILQTKLADKLVDGEMSYLNKMVSASSRMQSLIEDVLTLAKLSDNNLPVSSVNLRKVVRRIQEDLEITIKEKNADIVVGSLPEIEAVPGQMHQLFQNLISNALKFNDKEKPVITIQQCSISEVLDIPEKFNSEDYFCIQVADNGIGFEPEYVEKIFGIFQRLHGRQFEGTGIGLALAKKIVENHKGYISATGAPGQGAKFTILLPK